jgi:hypothetical protein
MNIMNTARLAHNHPDAGLIARCHTACEIHAGTTLVERDYENKGIDIPYETIIRPRTDRWHALCAEIAAIPALTRDGMRGKASVLADVVDESDGPMVASLVKDLMRTDAADSPDAELIAACEKHLAIQEACVMDRTDTQATPLAIVGRRIAQLREEIDRLDTDRSWEKPEWTAAVDEQDTLVEQAMALQPVTLQDAATLALCIARQNGYLEDFSVPRDDAEPYYERIGTAVAGILLVFRNMGVPLDDIGPIEADYEIRRRKFMPPLGCRACEEERTA